MTPPATMVAMGRVRHVDIGSPVAKTGPGRTTRTIAAVVPETDGSISVTANGTGAKLPHGGPVTRP